MGLLQLLWCSGQSWWPFEPPTWVQIPAGASMSKELAGRLRDAGITTEAPPEVRERARELRKQARDTEYDTPAEELVAKAGRPVHLVTLAQRDSEQPSDK